VLSGAVGNVARLTGEAADWTQCSVLSMQNWSKSCWSSSSNDWSNVGRSGGQVKLHREHERYEKPYTEKSVSLHATVIT